jgi:cation-transporting ATPase I
VGVSRLLRGAVSLPLHTVAAAAKTASTVTAVSVETVAGCAAAAVSAGVGLATTPVRRSVALVSSAGVAESVTQVMGGFVGGKSSRRSWQGGERCWIEVRGLNDAEAGSQLGAAVLDAIGDQPGVLSAQLNYPLSRVIVRVDGREPTLAALCDVVNTVEDRMHQSGDRPRRVPPTDLPADGVVLADSMVSVAVNAAGLCAALAGRVLLWPPLPAGLAAAVNVVDYQPRLRKLVEDRLGTTAADAALAVASAAVYTVTLAPASLAVDLLTNLAKAAELRSASHAWRRREPALSGHAACAQLGTPPRPRPRPLGPVERHADRSALAQALGASAIGLATRSPTAAATAAVVAAPKAARIARESFASTLGRGLADHHGVLGLRPAALRRLDRVDTVLIDPRALYTAELKVSRIRGAAERERLAAWQRAQVQLDRGLGIGWHRVEEPGGDSRNHSSPVEVLVRPVHHPLASALLGEVRRGGAEVVSIDVDTLDDLRSSFDDLHPGRGDPDAALAEAVTQLQHDGRTVAVLSAAASQALSAADVAIGLVPEHGPPPWHADLLVDDLASAWQVLHALAAARSASRRGVELATAATVLGALLMVPGVRGLGPGPVTAGAAAGAWTGYSLARGALRDVAPQPAPAQEWHAMSIDEVRRALPARIPPSDRLHPSQMAGTAQTPAAAVGRLAGRVRGGVWEFAGAVRSELSDPLTPLLAIGSAASAVLGSPIDAVLVGSVVVANAALAAGQQVRAERLLRRLLAVQDPPARVVPVDQPDATNYDNVDAACLQPGDVIEVRPGEVVPADARLIEAVDLEVDESSLTGESLPVIKQVAATPGAALAERSCMLYAATTAVAGVGLAVVTAVGAQTHARRAAEAPGAEASDVGLQTQLRQLTNRAWPVSLAGGAVVSALALLRLSGLRQALSSGVAVTVAAVPEGLPLVATLAQQASARRLTKMGVLVRSPRSVEALGRVDMVCFDKTGTLSENRLRVSTVHATAGFSRGQVLVHAAQATPPPNGGRHEHATDIAVINAAGDLPQRRPASASYLPFRSGRPYSAAVLGTELSIKGAPEVVLAACSRANSAVHRMVGEMATGGLRVIAVARRELTAEEAASASDDPETFTRLCQNGLKIVGLLGLSDTPRPEAAGVLAALSEEQVAVRLITGDHPVTATAIAAELGIPVTADQVISGAEWEALPRRGQEQAVTDRRVFARMSPEHKVQIVQTLERLGHVCAMVGDGANDAAAIRAATVGIGVATRGGDPARTAADVMLLDGRIEALLDALEEGRQLWRRVQAAVAVLLGGNAGEVAFAIAGTAITGRSPLNTRQLLLVNLLTDALPATALAVSPVNSGMPGAGRGPDQAALWRTVAVRGATTAAAAAVAWVLGSVTGRPRRASTVALVALVATQLGQTLLDSHSPLVVATAIGSLVAMAAVISTPGLSQLLGSTPLGPIGWAQALGTAAVATAAAAVAPRMISALSGAETAHEEPGESDASTISTTPIRHNTAYNSRNGRVSTRATTSVNGSALTPVSVTTAGNPSANTP